MPNLIGTAPNQVPTNGALGNMAFQNKEAVSVDTLVTTALTVTGTGALTVGGTQIVKDASGNLGLGVTPSAWDSPSRSLEIGNTVGLARSGSAEMLLSYNSFINASSQYTYRITAAASMYRQTAGAHSWFTAPSGTAGNVISFTQAMTLDASGRLMIGATSAQGTLYVANGSSKGFEFWPEISSATNLLMNYDRAGSVYQNLQIRAATHQWMVGASEAMRLDASGNLGLGVTPSAWGSTFKALQINTTDNGAVSAPYLQLFSNAFFNGTNYIYSTTGAATRFDTRPGGNAGFAWHIANSGTAGNAISFTQAMTLDASGNLGVGTTSTSSWRTRISNTTNQALSLQNSAGTGTRIQLVDTTWGGEIEQNAGAMIFKIGGTTEAMRIASDGKVGIGTTGATALLDVNADTVRVRTAKTPASATATGNAGDICWDSNYVYVCVATNTWKRSALSTW